MSRLANVCLAVCLLLPVVAQAFPIAPAGTEGLRVIVSGIGSVVATYEGNSATYSNDLYFGLSLETANTFVFNNHTTPVGTQVVLGTFPVGTELYFRLHVRNTGYDFYSGPASRNPDGYAHARVQAEWQPGTTLASFEDLYNGPFSYNDLSFSFTRTDTCTVICDAGGPYSGDVGTLIQFDGSGSHTNPSGCGEIVAFAWDFGDGGSGTGATPTHTYTADGTFQVTLCVTDSHGHTSCCSPPGQVVPATKSSWSGLKSQYK
ncbi:MAG: PKD domain-containing protein [Candidatus Krumholzibacteriia bacterium]